MSQSVKPKVILWSPFPHENGVVGGGIGGYARAASQMLRSFLSSEVTYVPVPMSVPKFHNRILELLYLIPRMIYDMVMIAYMLIKHRPDALHITSLYWRSIFREAWAAWVAKQLGVPLYFDVRAGTFDDFVVTKSVIMRACTRYIMRTASEIAVEGRKFQPLIKEHFNRDAHWVPNCFLEEDLAKYPAAELKEPAADEPVKLAYLGYVRLPKGPDVLLEIAQRLSQTRKVEVTLIGQVAPDFADILARYQAQQTENFKIVSTGRLSFEELIPLLQSMHVFVFLSRFFGEGQPNAVTEAMAMGLPVIASKQGFLDDVVTTDCGFKIDDPQDADAAYEALATLTNNWALLQQKGQNARERIETVFAGRVVLGRALMIYKRCRDKKAGVQVQQVS